MSGPACLEALLDEGATQDGRPSRVWLWLAPFLLVGLIAGASPWGLWEPDEGRYADVARQMLEHGDFVTPRINDVVFLDKPPLVYWVTAASLRVFGRNEFGARFGQILFAAGLLAVVCRLGLLLYDARRALIAVLVLGSSIGFFTSGHYLTLDLALAFFVSLTILCFLLASSPGVHSRGASSPGPREKLLFFAAAAAAAGGMLTKGPVALVLPGMTIASWLAIRRDWRRLREVPWVGAGLLFLALTAPWYVAVSIANPDFPRYFFLHENLARFATTMHHRGGAWGYYFVVVAAGLLPWTPLVIARLLRLRIRARGLAESVRSEAPALLLSWIVPGFLFFFLSRSKLPGYLLPLFPAVVLCVTPLLDRALRSEHRWREVFLWPLLTPAALLAGASLYWMFHQGEWSGAVSTSQIWQLVGVVAVVGVAAQVSGYLFARRGRSMLGLTAMACLWALGWFLTLAMVGRVGYLNDTRHFALALRAEGWSAEPVYTYRCYPRGLPFYLDTDVEIVDDSSDELAIGRVPPRAPSHFAGATDLLARLRGAGRVFTILPRRALASLQDAAGRPLFVLARTARFDLVSNQLGPGREAELRAALGERQVDLKAFAADAETHVPGGTPGLLEIKTRSGLPVIAVDVERKGTIYEVTYPIDGSADATVSLDDDLREEDDGQPFILRLAPSSIVSMVVPSL